MPKEKHVQYDPQFGLTHCFILKKMQQNKVMKYSHLPCLSHPLNNKYIFVII